MCALMCGEVNILAPGYILQGFIPVIAGQNQLQKPLLSHICTSYLEKPQALSITYITANALSNE